MRIIAVALALSLAGCQTIAAGLDAANKTLGQVAGNSLPAACTIVSVAQGYFEVLRPRISAANQRHYAGASAVADRICADRPDNVVSALVTLGRAWTDIQAATRAR